MEIKKILKEHWFYIVIILIVNIFMYGFLLNVNNIAAHDGLTFVIHRVELIRQSIFDYGHFWPLWNPYIMSGTPFYAQSGTTMIDSVLGIFLLITNNAAATLNLTMFTGIQLAGIFMYIFALYLFKNKKAALISSIVFVLNGSVASALAGGSLVMINAYLLIPLIMLFTVTATKKKEFVRYAILAGLFFGFQVRTGDIRVFSFTTLIFSFYLLFYVIGNNFSKKAVKAVLITVIAISIAFFVAAEKIFPAKEYIGLSSRSSLSWEYVTGGEAGLSVKKTTDFLNGAIEPVYGGMPKIRRKGASAHVGIIAFLLGCYGIYKKRKNKMALYLSALAIISFMIATGTFVYYFLWKYVPLWESFRHLHYRTIVIFAFAFSMLAGLGVKELFSTLKSKNFKKRTISIVFSGIVLAIFLNLFVFGSNPEQPSEDINKAIEDNSIMQEISKDQDIFRIATYETRGIDWGSEFAQVPYKIQHIYGYETEWYQPYLNIYLSVANQAPAKFWGILNTKYMTSLEKVNVTNFRLVGEFTNKEEHYPATRDIQKAWGKYLYENELFLPRVYFVENSILVVGNEDAGIQTIYALMLDDRFNPGSTVIIKGKGSINDYDINDLKKYKAIFLTQGSVDERSNFILKNYVDNGGILIPNIVEGETSVDGETIGNMLNSFKGDIQVIDDNNYITHNFDKYEVKLGGVSGGFLVLSEKFSVFNGWSSEFDILNADGMISAVYVDKPIDSITFTYLPKSVVIGKWISILSIILIIGYFGFLHYRKLRPKQSNSTS